MSVSLCIFVCPYVDMDKCTYRSSKIERFEGEDVYTFWHHTVPSVD